VACPCASGAGGWACCWPWPWRWACWRRCSPAGSLPPLALQRPPAELRLQGGPPQSPAPERLGQPWELVRLGPLQITQRSAELGINGATLLFTVVHSANLLLLTTAPEQLVWAISWALAPLARLGWPVERLGFTLLLALRFVPLVQEELQNLLRALATRAVVFKRLGWKGGLALVLAGGERLLANVLLRAEQGAEALLARGGHWIEPSRLHQGAAAAAGPTAWRWRRCCYWVCCAGKSVIFNGPSGWRGCAG
jgi:energy-coupling factor transport system permease protein